MSILGLLTDLVARPGQTDRAANLSSAILWRALLGLAILFLIITLWRVLEFTLGPILAPLSMALFLSLFAGVMAFQESRRRRRIQATAPSLAPLVSTVLQIAFAPKLVRWFALGSLVYDTFINGTGPVATQMAARKPQNRVR